MIKIDGSYLEGGGQILRTALALSVITKKSFEITSIRKNRPNPGLKAQHLNSINTLKEIFDIDAADTYIGSQNLAFEIKDNKPKKNAIVIDIGTAGSITLLMQSVIPSLIFSQKKTVLEVRGGTDVSFSPSIDYMNHVFLPQISKYFEKIDIKISRRGYFPKGGGIATLEIIPRKIVEAMPVKLESKGRLLQIKGISHASKDLEKANVAERQAEAARIILRKYGAVNISTEYRDSFSTGSGITLWAIFSSELMYDDNNELDVNPINPIILGSDALGERSKSSEAVGEECARNLVKEMESGGACDKHLADQLIPYLGLFKGKLKTSEITKHAITNIYTTEKFLDVKFDADKENNTISVK